MRWVLALLIAGCYSPTPSPGAPCAIGGGCPSGLECRNEICVLPGSPPSDGPRADAPADSASDGPPPDMTINLTGCADGEREGFPNVAEFPTIAGCGATWIGTKNMRAAKSGGVCGDDLNDCVEPADACAAGWSVCGIDGNPKTISDRADANACLTVGGLGTGAFAAGLSHCTDPLVFCKYDAPYPCTPTGDCSESVCCGPDCSAKIGCPDGVYPGTTRVAAANSVDGCGALGASTITGVLCCED